MPIASSASTIASVPLATPIVWSTPRYSAASRSNASTSGPKMKRPLSRARENASFSSGIRGAYCALTSTSGIGGTAAHRRGATPPDDQVSGKGNDRNRHEDLDITERVVELLPACAERIPGGCEPERPDRAADRGQGRVARKRSLEDAGGDRDERARDRREAADEDGPVLP